MGTWILLNGSNLWLMPLLREGLSYEPLRDFIPVSLLSRTQLVLSVNASSPFSADADQTQSRDCLAGLLVRLQRIRDRAQAEQHRPAHRCTGRAASAARAFA